MSEKTEALNFRIESDLKAAFLAACKRKDVSAAQVLRLAARDFLRRHEAESMPPKKRRAKL